MCVFDGVTLLRLDFGAVTQSGIKNTNNVRLEMAYDAWLDGDEVHTGRTSYSTTQAGTVRAVLFDTLLTGIRRISLTQNPLPYTITVQGQLWQPEIQASLGKIRWRDQTGRLAEMPGRQGYLASAQSTVGDVLIFRGSFNEGEKTISRPILPGY